MEPISFDDLPLGGEWTTRRRTISESEIALFAAVAGDFSPLTIDATHSAKRLVPPALVVAMAVGLGSMDMPVPSVAEWEWLNWKFPRPVHAGDTIYARWTLTQKRPPVGRVATAIVVWRVDVHTADGALCAEGEVGASVTRQAVSTLAPVNEQEAAAPAAASTSRRRRRRRTTPAATGTKTVAVGAVPVVEAAAPAAAPAAGATPERSSGGARRRRRRRPASSLQPRTGDVIPAATPLAPSEASAPTPRASTTATVETANPLSRVIRRLRRT
ncbi:MAG TPA: MaoC/PaaZ C-terminal domain-containing protein [Candidatus Dormibacteraeota bacterium]|nr:MaoC/PaaZ C-terminal domain-containing protein [Candidatus Dormibacteraeota bacterium]